ncbi:hypothetical protein ACSQ67_025359 [Phaseolus vulgaris]
MAGRQGRERRNPGRAGIGVGRSEQRSFAQVVSGEVARSGIGGNAGGAHGEEVSEPTVALESPSWLEGCYVGSLKVVSCMQALKECFVLGGVSHVGIRRLGESYVLLSCDEGEGLSKILTENKAWFDEMFLTVAPWDESFAVKERSMWLRCERHPASNVVRSVLFGVGELVGEVVEIDEATKKKEKLEYKRQVSGFFHKKVSGNWDGGGSEVDTEASSEEGSVGASLGVSAKFEFEAVGGGEVGDEGGGGTEVYGGGDDVRAGGYHQP